MYFKSDPLEFPSSPPRIRNGLLWTISCVAVPCFLKWGIAEVLCGWTDAIQPTEIHTDTRVIRNALDATAVLPPELASDNVLISIYLPFPAEDSEQPP
jgi:hypothetical protein